MTSYVVGYIEHECGEVKYYATYAESAQEAADIVRFDMSAYQVTEVFKKVKNWK